MAAENQVPVLPLRTSGRIAKLKESFATQFGQEPAFYVRVPGRVNLIGEHIDYCGYGVCPMALEQDIVLAVSPQEETTLTIRNLDNNFPDYKCDIKNFEIVIGDGAPAWYQYFLCGVKGILETLPEEVDLKGYKVMVSGNIPQSAGLSSSSALVSSAALATAHVHKVTMSKEKIANLCAECERYIGTQGGGMDQAIAFLATEGCAKLIEFAPLRSRDLRLPPDAVFVIAHSLTRMNKAASNDFNCRVVECRLAAQVMAKHQGLDWTGVRKLGELHQALGADLAAMVAVVRDILHEEPYSKDEVLQELEVSAEQLDRVSLTPNTKHVQTFKLHQRALHVFQEALRVEKFHKTCADLPRNNSLETLGRLMVESHESLRDLYECSHPQLDRLVELSQELTYGARLTGAGWGGCAVALVSPDNVQKYIQTLKEKFYGEVGDSENLDFLVFGTTPNGGACVLVPNCE